MKHPQSPEADSGSVLTPNDLHAVRGGMNALYEIPREKYDPFYVRPRPPLDPQLSASSSAGSATKPPPGTTPPTIQPVFA